MFGPAASATQPECKAINQTKDVSYNSSAFADPLGTAIAAADSGDTIEVIGTCTGPPQRVKRDRVDGSDPGPGEFLISLS